MCFLKYFSKAVLYFQISFPEFFKDSFMHSPFIECNLCVRNNLDAWDIELSKKDEFPAVMVLTLSWAR